jgi:osmoprotectant transport system ATP-binding protein
LSIRLRGATKRFAGAPTPAVDDVGFEVADGETLVLLGSSGCGKTTTLKLINRLIEPTSGTIEVDGRDVKERDPIELRRSIGYVFQGIGLLPHLTVGENVEIVPRLLGRSRAERRRRARELLETVGLPPDEFAERRPRDLSGGQRQRVGVARALAAKPRCMLMDEPFGALDAVTRDSLQQELLALKKRLDVTIVFVTHDIFEALTLADRIAVMHEGRIEQIDEPEGLMRRPRTEFVRELFDRPARQLQAYQERL